MKDDTVSVRAVRILILGDVQGHGVRPELARLAIRNHWSGLVRNTNLGVELVLHGVLPGNDELCRLIDQSVPPQATIKDIRIEPELDASPSGFSIVESTDIGILSAPIPCDVGICNDCLAEVRDPLNRRYRYPFTTCARCGPRYSLINSMPFDRSRTTMRMFSLCTACLHEYQDPANRRFHAQTLCCPDCGPHVWLSDHSDTRLATDDDALCHSAREILKGRILAIRGVGGYQLLADANHPAAIDRLRRRKRRSEKPFALMCRSLADAERLVHLSDIEAHQLTAAANPIVLLRQRKDSASALPAAINAPLNELGILLPTTALHDRLLELIGGPVICTSGNIDGNPLVYGIEEACQQLSSVADLFLHHDREISHPIDDSVVKVIAGNIVSLRCGRGLAPMSLPLVCRSPIIAVGGQMKTSVAGSNGQRSWLGPHLGDLDVVAVQQRWSEQIGTVDRQKSSDFPEAQREPKPPECTQFVHDAHPEYFSTVWCADHAIDPQVVWHHHAHIAAGMLQHHWLDRPVLGVAFDGTGLGTDGTIWGGEFLIATATGFQRIGHLRPFGLPGGEAAIIDLRRILFSLLSQLDDLSACERLELTRLSASEHRRQQQVLDSSMTIRTTSCGRLFDALACLILRIDRPTFDGQAAMYLESCCDPAAEGEYRFDCLAGPMIQLDWRPVLTQIITELHREVSTGEIAMRFHRGLARAIVDVCQQYPQLPVVLSGGVFQNRVLVELISDLWPAGRDALGIPGIIPPNDGGLAAGQLVVAARRNEMKVQSCAWESPGVSTNGSIATP